MLVALAVELGDGVVLLLQSLYAVEQRVCDVLLWFVFVVMFCVVNRALHLADCCDEAPGLFSKVMFLFRNLVQLVV